jgi:hypothetical protein
LTAQVYSLDDWRTAKGLLAEVPFHNVGDQAVIRRAAAKFAAKVETTELALRPSLRRCGAENGAAGRLPNQESSRPASARGGNRSR